MSPEEKFEDLVDEFTGRPGITPPGTTGGFGRSALRAHGRIFAMFVRGQLVLKLPGVRVDELVEGGHGVRFDANKGTPDEGVAGPGRRVAATVVRAGGGSTRVRGKEVSHQAW